MIGVCRTSGNMRLISLLINLHSLLTKVYLYLYGLYINLGYVYILLMTLIQLNSFIDSFHKNFIIFISTDLQHTSNILYFPSFLLHFFFFLHTTSILVSILPYIFITVCVLFLLENRARVWFLRFLRGCKGRNFNWVTKYDEKRWNITLRKLKMNIWINKTIETAN